MSLLLKKWNILDMFNFFTKHRLTTFIQTTIQTLELTIPPMTSKFLKHSVLTALTLIGLSSVATQAQVLTFNSVTGYSNVQGANGWSYAGVYFQNSSNLWTGSVLGAYNEVGNSWDVIFPGIGDVTLTQTSQNYQPGNAIFSLRYWTADQDYASVTLTSTIEATVPLGAYIIFGDLSTLTDSVVAGPAFATEGGIAAGGGTEVMSLGGTVNDVAAGDRIYFFMQNAGTAFDNKTQQVWNQTVTATVPEPSTMVLVAVGAGLGLWRFRKNLRFSGANSI